ncbi:MAG: DUF1080 domain-containing protein [Saprospiraceae bacterium]|nr:DUF1080 domain-containing protein [Saprospiraceae bacterium]
MRILVFALLMGLAATGCNEKMQQATNDAGDATTAMIPNTLTAEEQQEGWKLLFDGKSMNQWRNFQSESTGQSWKVDDGSIVLVTAITDGKSRAIDGGDIITKEAYENFDFKIDWMIKECGNSGIMWGVQEGDFEKPYHTGPEMQILDNTCHPDAKIHMHRAGDLYDLIPCSEETVKPAGQWNSARIRMDQGKGTFWLNGVQVVSFTMFDDQWKAMVADSKFKQWPAFGTFRKGHICLQDHSDPVRFRNIKIREL